MNKEEIFLTLDDLFPEMVEIRRELHMHPELSFQEVETAKFIADYQEKLGLEVRRGVGGNGVVATLRGGKKGKTIAIRADFDALPIQEMNDVPYKSQNPGVMHACGHDAHTAIALGLSKAFVKYCDELEGNIVFIHQHAEEVSPGGAKSMIEDGALEGVDAIFATHMENYLSVGSIAYSKDYILAASDEFEIEILGHGGHGAFPHDTKDSLLIGTQVVNNLQHIVSRRINPMKTAVVTVGSFHAGSAPNVIPETAAISGTVRTFDKALRGEMPRLIEETVKHTCAIYGADYRLNYQMGYPATLNDKEMTEVVIKAAEEVIDEDQIVEIPPNMGGEDFSYYLEEIPGCYFFTGTANEEKGFIYPYHHEKWDIDENALLYAAKILASAALKA